LGILDGNVLKPFKDMRALQEDEAGVDCLVLGWALINVLVLILCLDFCCRSG
jgi:hypothetical protein